MLGYIFDYAVDNRAALITISALGGLIIMGIRLLHEHFRISETLRAGKLHKRMSESQGAPAFTKQEIASSLRFYVEPMCAQDDPSNQSDLRSLAEVREPVMRAVDRFIAKGGEHRHLLLLSDSGMGKTTFALNYFNRALKRSKKSSLSCAVIPLGRSSAVDQIREVQRPSDTVLILDALDEDPDSVEGNNSRIQDLMNASADFAAVILTCRSQFFPNDAAIPNETGVSMIGPRRAGESGAYKFYRLYLLPFSEDQVSKYLSNNFPIWSFVKRGAAQRLVRDIPELSVRPMLLALIPDLARSRSQVTELYDLYQFMIDQWLERESRWISKDKLWHVSKRLAVYMFCETPGRVRDRVTATELAKVADDHELGSEWRHLTGRSLLNRDSAGLYKFSHRSILEFLFVTAAIEGEDACFNRPWTEFMRELFVSWGTSHSTISDVARAREILSMDLRETQLLPLSAPLPTPRALSPADLMKSFTGARRDVKRRRPLPAQWRIDSLKLREDGSLTEIFDFEYDLVWRIVRTQEIADQSDRDTYKHTIADLSRRLDSGWRLPSSAELMSLIEAEKTLNLGSILDPHQYYWIGDRLGQARHIVASLSNGLSDERLKPFDLRVPNAQNLPVRLHELKRVTKRGENKPFSAMCVAVSNGAERLWHAPPSN